MPAAETALPMTALPIRPRQRPVNATALPARGPSLRQACLGFLTSTAALTAAMALLATL